MSKATSTKIFHIIPNTVTCLNLLCGFIAITFCFQDKLGQAYWMILLAAISDAFDGRIARSTGTESEFGAQLDSLADVISFGLAPAMIIWTICYPDLGRYASFVAFAYVCATALRLARFNSEDRQEQTSTNFNGLPCPAAAIGCIVVPWLSNEINLSAMLHPTWLLWGWGLILAGAQISNIAYPSGKNLKISQSKFLIILWLIGIVLALMFINPALVLAPLGICYIIIPPLIALKKHVTNKKLTATNENPK